MIETLIVSFYVTVMAFAIFNTWREQRASCLGSPLFHAMGYLLCMVWPVTTLCLATMICVRRA